MSDPTYGLLCSGTIKVLWNDGNVEKCKYGVNGVYDVTLIQESDIDRSTMMVGALVERGE